MAEIPKLSDAQKKQIADALQRKGAARPCPRCGNNSWILADGYFNNPIQVQVGALVIGGPSIPSVVVVCSNCGFISQHALGALGLLPQKPEGEK